MEGKIASIEEKLYTLFKKLDGNGAPGLIEKVDQATEYIIAEKAKQENKAKLDTMTREELLKKIALWGSIILPIAFVILSLLLEIIKKKLGF